MPDSIWHSDLGMCSSMGRTGVCWDNSMAESFFSILKNERVHRTAYATKVQARRHVILYIEGSRTAAADTKASVVAVQTKCTTLTNSQSRQREKSIKSAVRNPRSTSVQQALQRMDKVDTSILTIGGGLAAHCWPTCQPKQEGLAHLLREVQWLKSARLLSIELAKCLTTSTPEPSESRQISFVGFPIELLSEVVTVSAKP